MPHVLGEASPALAMVRSSVWTYETADLTEPESQKSHGVIESPEFESARKLLLFVGGRFFFRLFSRGSGLIVKLLIGRFSGGLRLL